MTAALSLASALHGRPMLVASWQVDTAQPHSSTSWVYPAELLQRVNLPQVLPQVCQDDVAGVTSLLPALVGPDQASELLRDMASDLNGGRACRWSQDEAMVGPCSTVALELRSLKLEPTPGLQRRYLLLCAIFHDTKREALEELCSDMDALMIRNRIDKALAAMTQLATQDAFNDFRPQAEAARWLPSTLKYHAELFDSEVFCSRAMSMARIPSALVTLTLPQGSVALEEGVYCASMSEDLGAVIAIKPDGANRSQVMAEMSCFRIAVGGAGRETSMVPLDSIRTSGSLRDLRWLRPFYHKLASRQGSVGLQKQVQLDVLEARNRLRSAGSEPSKRRRVSLDATRTASLPPYLVLSEILSYMDLLELGSWAVSSKNFYQAAAQQATRALTHGALHFPPPR